MGECGCGADAPEYRIEGADGFHYGIGLYTGCEYCHTPIALDIYRYNDEDAELWLDHLKPVAVPGYGDDPKSSGVLGVPFLEPGHLATALKKLVEESPGFPVEDLDADDIRGAVQDAIWTTREEYDRLAKKRGS